MKDLLTDALARKLTSTLDALGGARAVYGDPVSLNGESLLPVARITVTLSAAAEGSGGGHSGLGSLAPRAHGNGGGTAEAGVRVLIEPLGYLRATADGPVFCRLE